MVIEFPVAEPKGDVVIEGADVHIDVYENLITQGPEGRNYEYAIYGTVHGRPVDITVVLPESGIIFTDDSRVMSPELDKKVRDISGITRH